MNYKEEWEGTIPEVAEFETEMYCDHCGEEIFQEYVLWDEGFYCLECLENMSTRGLLDFFHVDVLWK